jgi:beta-1,4-mannosyl-glycoprotein beta-1,4-N-acetylglucosaminyltransferase
VGDLTPQQIWNNEILQRNALLVPGIQDDDIMMISDVDEIPSREIVPQLKREPTKLEQRFSYYYLNMIQQNPRTVWYGTVSAVAREIRRVTPQTMRLCLWSKNPEMPSVKAGWHFSYTGGAKKIKAKLESFSHSEYNTPLYKDLSRIKQKMKTGEDLFDRPDQYFAPTPIDDTFPHLVRERPERFKDMICKV